MRKIIIHIAFTIILFSSGNVFSQNIPDQSPYVGKWIGTQNGDSLIIEFELKDYFVKPLNKSIQLLYGKYEYKSDSNLEREVRKEIEYPLEAGIVNDNGPRKFIAITFRDKVLVKAGSLRLYIDDNNQNKLEWRLSNTEIKMLNATKAEIEERKRFSVPTEITLYRMK